MKMTDAIMARTIVPYSVIMAPYVLVALVMVDCVPLRLSAMLRMLEDASGAAFEAAPRPVAMPEMRPFVTGEEAESSLAHVLRASAYTEASFV